MLIASAASSSWTYLGAEFENRKVEVGRIRRRHSRCYYHSQNQIAGTNRLTVREPSAYCSRCA